MNLHAESKFSPTRVALLRYGAVSIVVLLLVSFWQLQVVRSDYYTNLAERNRIRTLPVMAPRGIIYDRNGRTLVDYYAAFSVVVLREDVPEIRDSLDQIARGLHLQRAWLENRLAEHADAPLYQPIMLKDVAKLADIAFVEAHRSDLPQLQLVMVYPRRYPEDSLGAHLFGYVGEATSQEIAAHGYALGDRVGKTGLEHLYNHVLMGQNGQRRVIVDSRGKEVEKLDRQEPIAGQPIRLTIDYDIQQTAEKMMEGHKGALVALDPRTGDVLALVSRPAFDPNHFAVRIGAEQWRLLTQNPDKPILNRATQAQLAPGSVFKVIIAAAALEEGLFDRPFTVQCPGWARHYDRTFRCWRPQGHGTVGLHRALVESCDVFFYEVGKWLGIERIARYARRFGLGSPTGIDLPGEEEGLVPSPEWKQRVRKQPWWLGETISVAIGQGPITVTPLQLAYALGGIASGGVFARPRVLLTDKEPERRRVPLQADTVAILTDALWGVVNEAGTGTVARLPGIDMAGKTGTAQIISFDTLRRLGGKPKRAFIDNAWFVGLAPRRNPEIVVAVLIEHGEHGSSAAPLAREVIRTYYEKTRPSTAAAQLAALPASPAAPAEQQEQ